MAMVPWPARADGGVQRGKVEQVAELGAGEDLAEGVVAQVLCCREEGLGQRNDREGANP